MFRNLGFLGSQGVGTSNLIWQRLARLAFAAIVALTTLMPPTISAANAASGDRTLYLSSTHRDDVIRVTFKRNGKYDKDGLRQLNYFLRDWRTNDVIEFDPLLFDLVWEVYQESGASEPIRVVSSYRSPKTNAMLAAKSSAVADNSQHMKGKAMDFFIPGVDISSLRAIAMRKQFGGVGYYPNSGSPFVHLDTGSVRAWPRMTRAQLKKVFPDGKTLHVPTDGTPLSNDGYQYAQGQWQQCHMVPCNRADILVASADEDAPTPAGPRTTLMDLFFGDDDNTDIATTQVADTGPTQRAVETIAVSNAPVPLVRPASLGGTEMMVASLEAETVPFSTEGSAPLDPNMPYPVQKSTALMLATRSPLPSDSETAISAIASLDAPMPVARTLMTPVDNLVTAYAAEIVPDPGAQRALEMIIERETTASVAEESPVAQPMPALVGATALRTASLGNGVGINALSSLFDATFSAVANAGVKQPVTEAAVEVLAAGHPLRGIETRQVALVLPDMDHVELFAQPESLSGAGYAVIFDRDEADFNPATELGGYVTRVGFELDPTTAPTSDRFDTEAPLLIAAQ